MNIKAIQDYLDEHEIDGWLLADFHARNEIAVRMLNLSGIVTRRSFYFIPAEGAPVGLVHAIEQDKFAHLEGEIIPYSSYVGLETELEKLLRRYGRVAMEFSEKGRLPYIGLVDAGTIDLVKSFGVNVVSSADLVASFQARLDVEQIAMHRIAAGNLIDIKGKAFAYIKDCLENNRTVREYDVQQFMLDQFEKCDMTTASAPICAVEANAGNPHYEPSAENSREIKKNELVLIDLWAKIKHDNAIFADISWMAFTGTRDAIPGKYIELFSVIAQARDAAVSFLRQNIDGRPVYGSEVDDVCRKVITDAGHGDAFTHRTGHSITTSEHGTGPNIDNLETEDRRKLQKGHLFSIEPGVYFDDCGLRTEIDVLIGHNGVEVTTLPLQSEILSIF
jgi:Xaa-Pro aminopeptidase